jgi:hypothetical protein
VFIETLFLLYVMVWLIASIKVNSSCVHETLTGVVNASLSRLFSSRMSIVDSSSAA